MAVLPSVHFPLRKPIPNFKKGKADQATQNAKRNLPCGAAAPGCALGAARIQKHPGGGSHLKPGQDWRSPTSGGGRLSRSCALGLCPVSEIGPAGHSRPRLGAAPDPAAPRLARVLPETPPQPGAEEDSAPRRGRHRLPAGGDFAFRPGATSLSGSGVCAF